VARLRPSRSRPASFQIGQLLTADLAKLTQRIHRMTFHQQSQFGKCLVLDSRRAPGGMRRRPRGRILAAGHRRPVDSHRVTRDYSRTSPTRPRGFLFAQSSRRLRNVAGHIGWVFWVAVGAATNYCSQSAPSADRFHGNDSDFNILVFAGRSGRRHPNFGRIPSRRPPAVAGTDQRAAQTPKMPPAS
jgi:hypothetical protein